MLGGYAISIIASTIFDGRAGEEEEGMKAKELAEKLLEYPDFDVDIAISGYDESSYGYVVTVYDVVGIGDIGHSDKKVRLDVDC